MAQCKDDNIDFVIGARVENLEKTFYDSATKYLGIG
jgi:hypothetical protein